MRVIANLILGDAGAAPHWLYERYDVVWAFDRRGEGRNSWSFAQVPQLLLAGDSAEPIR